MFNTIYVGNISHDIHLSIQIVLFIYQLNLIGLMIRAVGARGPRGTLAP